MSSLHLILPVEFFCEMYNQKAGFELTPETLPQLLAEVPSNFNPCAIKDGRILLKKNDSDDFYTRLEQGRKPFGLYLPTVKEITMLPTTVICNLLPHIRICMTSSLKS